MAGNAEPAGRNRLKRSRSGKAGLQGFIVLFVIGLTLLLSSSLPVAEGSVRSSPLLGKGYPAGPSLPMGWPSFDNGNVTFVFNGSVPSLTLVSDTNTSFQASLSMENIMEVVPAVPPVGRPVNYGPLDLLAKAYASPTGSTAFHIAVSGNLSSGGGLWVNMSNDIPVHSLSIPGLSGLPVWQNPDGEIPSSAIGGAVGSVNVTVSFHIPHTGSSGLQDRVSVTLSVSNWPWVYAASDALALEWQFFTPSISGAQPVSCNTAPSNGTTTLTPCSGATSLQAGQAVWANSSMAVESVSQTTLLSYLDWPSSGVATTSAGQSVMPLDAALFPISGSNLIRMMQVTAVGAGAVVNFTEDPTLGLLLPPSSVPLLSPLAPEVQGYLVPFLASVVIGIAVVMTLRGLKQRREREHLRNL